MKKLEWPEYRLPPINLWTVYPNISKTYNVYKQHISREYIKSFLKLTELYNKRKEMG